MRTSAWLGCAAVMGLGFFALAPAACASDPPPKKEAPPPPPPPPPDSDGDGVADLDDACRDQPGPPPDGCPLADADGDGLPDHLDGCPHEAEDLDGEDDADGCPEGARQLAAGEILQERAPVAIAFRRGKAELSEAGARALAALTDDLAPRAGTVVTIRIEATAGQKETRGQRAASLAAERAERVRRALLHIGVPPSRFAVQSEVRTGPDGRQAGEVMVAVAIAAREAGSQPTDAGPQ